MSLKDDVINMKKEVKEMQEQSFARELLNDYRKQNKRLFIMWIITFLTLIGVTCYTIYLLNDIGTIETSETITEDYDVNQNSGDGGNNNFITGNNNEVDNG